MCRPSSSPQQVGIVISYLVGCLLLASLLCFSSFVLAEKGGQKATRTLVRTLAIVLLVYDIDSALVCVSRFQPVHARSKYSATAHMQHMATMYFEI